ncbi:hypothetical protein [Cupriavidus metallidurans]|uniref:hypothetical protein n=1 Tax=Cupriavidus metallidurans TaxID=119219 RepID=UPI001CCDAE5E|nr:hypothetical protein [Cupriavidus metallidurans]UBM07593.1 hypothetical protein LAI70_07620 [Cupriavidus metallidurans]
MATRNLATSGRASSRRRILHAPQPQHGAQSVIAGSPDIARAAFIGGNAVTLFEKQADLYRKAASILVTGNP